MSTKGWSYYLSGPTMADRAGVLLRFRPGQAERWSDRLGWNRVPVAEYLTGKSPTAQPGGRFLSVQQARRWATTHHADAFAAH